MSINDPIAHLRQLFPNLSTAAQKTSEPAHYNCLAWAAAADQRLWWERILGNQLLGGYYWPRTVLQGNTIVGWIRTLETEGFKVCDDREYEAGYTKVAIYIKDSKPKHVARQLGPDAWTSKVGGLEDIEHPSLEELEGDEFGYVGPVLKKEGAVP